MVVPLLPQELLELIVDDVYASGGTDPLKRLSRISKAWRPRSQNHIFRKFTLNCATMRRIHSETTATAAKDTDTSQRPPIVFSYVRKLRIVARQITSPENDEEYLQVLPFFTNVTSLRILDWDFREFETQHINRFLSHFGATVRTLKLQECYVDSEVLIFLMSSFPLVDNLEIDPRYPCSSVTYRIQKSDRPSGSIRFRGNLIFRFLGAQHEDFLEFVNENSADVHSISAELCVNKGELQRLFDRRGGNLSSVGVHFLWKQDFVSLSSCTQLQTLAIHLLTDFKPDDQNWDTLLTVTSPLLEEIKIHSFDGLMNGEPLVGWEGIDDLLCQHYDRGLENGIGNFRVSLHPTDLDSEQDCADLLRYVGKVWPRFVKKGTVTLSLEESKYYGLGPSCFVMKPGSWKL